MGMKNLMLPFRFFCYFVGFIAQVFIYTCTYIYKTCFLSPLLMRLVS